MTTNESNEEWGWYVEGGSYHDGFASRAEAIKHALVEHEEDPTRVLVGRMRDVDLGLYVDPEYVAEYVEENLNIEDNSVHLLAGAQEALEEWARKYLTSECARYCDGAHEPAITEAEIEEAKR